MRMHAGVCKCMRLLYLPPLSIVKATSVLLFWKHHRFATTTKECTSQSSCLKWNMHYSEWKYCFLHNQIAFMLYNVIIGLEIATEVRAYQTSLTLMCPRPTSSSTDIPPQCTVLCCRKVTEDVPSKETLNYSKFELEYEQVKWPIDCKYVSKAFGNMYTKHLVFVMVLNCRKIYEKLWK